MFLLRQLLGRKYIDMNRSKDAQGIRQRRNGEETSLKISDDAKEVWDIYHSKMNDYDAHLTSL